MIIHIASRMLIASALLCAPFGGAQAQVEQRSLPPSQAEEATAPLIDAAEARRIAIDNGMVRIEDIEIEDGVWQIDGTDNGDAEIEIELDAATGVILRLDRNRSDFAEILR